MNIPEFTAQASLYRTSNRYWSSALNLGGSLPNQPVVPAQGCMQMPFQGAGVESYRGQPELMLYFTLPSRCNDVINIMWATPGGSWQQLKFDPYDDDFGFCIPYNGHCTYRIGHRINANLDEPYLFKVQSCRTRALASSVCGPWSYVAQYCPGGRDCGSNCCAQGEYCCGDTCCPQDHKCCGDGTCCPPDLFCLEGGGCGYPRFDTHPPPPPSPVNNCIFGGEPCGPKCCFGDTHCCGYSVEFGADCRRSCVH